MTPNETLVQAIRARQQKQTEFNYGIATADAFVRTLLDCVGSDLCYRYAARKNASFEDALRKAAKTLTYSNDEMVIEEKATDLYASGKLPDGIVLPKNTLMVFRHVLTTPRKDRDGDILRTQGAEIDPKMLLLWQHVHTLPIGKYLGTDVHTSKKLSVYSAIVDINELAHDAAVMVENDMGRFSHGFRAIAFDNLKEEGGRTSGKGGFDVKQFEIMEESLVSVPSNIGADTEEVLLSLVDSKKLKSPLMQGVGKRIREKSAMSAVTVPVKVDLQLMLNGKNINGTQSGLEAKGGSKEGCTCGGTPEEADGKASGKAGADDKEMTCGCGGTYKNGVCDKCGAKMGKDTNGEEKAKKAKECPDCGAPLNEDGICEECGYGMEEEKAAVDQDEAGADNDMGVVMCPDCGTVALKDGKCPKCGATPPKAPKSSQPDWTKGYVSGSNLSGSWENIQSGLYEKVTSFVKNNGIDIGAAGGLTTAYAYLLATYDGNAIISINRPNGETAYYRAEWKSTPEGPKFVGSLKEVRVEVSAKIIEKAVKLAGVRSGRVLSSRNKAALQGVRDNIYEVHEKELLITKGGRALCREGVKTLDEVIKSSEPVPTETSVLDIDAKTAMAEFLAKATPEERSRMAGAIKSLELIDKKDSKTQKIRRLVAR